MDGIRQQLTTWLVLVVAVLGACERAGPATPGRAGVETPIHVDSILPVDEEIRRFRATLGGRTATRLQRGAASRAELISRFVLALESADTAALRAMTLDAAEFIDLYYPHTIYTSKPYQLSPAIVWLLHSQESEKGIGRALRRFGGRPLTHDTSRCAPEPRIAGPNRVWHDCVLEAHTDGRTERSFLLGAILERDGRFAFVSYANDL